MVIVPAGSSLPFEYTAADMGSSLFVAMKVYETTLGSPVLVTTIGMTHVVNGTYLGFFTAVDGKTYLINKMVYTDGTYTSVSTLGYSPGSESFRASTQSDVGSIAGAVWDEDRSAHTIVGTFGESNQGVVSTGRATNLDKLDANISTRAPAATAVSTVDLTVTRINKLDQLDAAISTREAESAAATRFSAVAKDATVAQDATVAKASALASVATEVGQIHTQTGQLSTDYTTARAAKLDRIDVNVSTRASQTSVDSGFAAAAQDSTVAKEATLATVNTKIGTPASSVSADIAAVKADTGAIKTDVETTGVKTLPADKDTLVDLVWNELTSGHTTAGTTGKALTDAAAPTSVSGTDINNIAAAVWNETLAAHTTAGTVGANQNLIDEAQADAATLVSRLTSTRATKLDFLDVAVSSRESESSAASRASAQATAEATTQSAVADVQTSANTINSKLGAPAGASVSADIAAVKTDTGNITAKTSNLPSDPASQSAIATALAPIAADASAASTKASQIKAKTDNLPASPADEASVLAIPTNPLLTSDTRLNHLDANISSRTAPSDLVPLAKTTDVTASTASILASEASIATSLATKPSSTDLTNAVAPLAKEATLQTVKSEIEALPAGELTAAAVWSYTVRSLTVPVATTIDLTPIAKTTEVTAVQTAILAALPEYEVHMTTAINPAVDELEIQMWLSRDRTAQTGTSTAQAVFYNGLGAPLFSLTDSSSDAQGIFRMLKTAVSGSLAANQTYTVKLTIDGHVSTKPFTVF